MFTLIKIVFLTSSLHANCLWDASSFLNKNSENQNTPFLLSTKNCLKNLNSNKYMVKQRCVSKNMSLHSFKFNKTVQSSKI